MTIPRELCKLTPDTLTLDQNSRWKNIYYCVLSACQAPAGQGRRVALILEGRRLELSSGVPIRCGLKCLMFSPKAMGKKSL